MCDLNRKLHLVCMSKNWYLDNGRVLRKRSWRLGRLTNGDVLNITPSKHDVLEYLISRCNRPLCWAPLRTKRAYCIQCAWAGRERDITEVLHLYLFKRVNRFVDSRGKTFSVLFSNWKAVVTVAERLRFLSKSKEKLEGKAQ